MPERDVVPADADEVLSGGGLPRWLAVLAVVAVVAAATGYLVMHSGGSAHKAPTPTRSRQAYGAAEAFDVAGGSSDTWVLSGRRLSYVSARRVVRSVALGELNVSVGSRPRLAVDRQAKTVWVVVANATPSRMLEFNAATLRKVRTVTWTSPVAGAVAYRGHLYLSSDVGVADLRPRARQPQVIAGLGGAVGPIALDPARHRLIAIDLGYPTDVWAFWPGRRPVEAVATLPFGQGSVAVADGRIWVGGFGAHSAVLERLDPATLAPVAHAEATQFGRGVAIIAGGARAVWVLPGDRSGPLACISAETGQTQQRWDLPAINAVASDSSGALVATRSGVLGLILSRCAG
ncbi:MAG TPA: hypothetical protein VKB75_08900 [Jatrophihabitans sp.]|nr:hypothetical protein [Jatrophihabitans sp.]